MSLVSMLLRVALTAAIFAFALLIASGWDSHQREIVAEVWKFGIIVALLVLAGVIGIVWTFRTKWFGVAIRLTLSVPLMACMFIMLVWISPPFEKAVSMAFKGAVVVALASLYFALWYYWPEKKKN